MLNVAETQTAAFERAPARARIGITFEVVEPLFALADALIVVGSGIAGAILYQAAVAGAAGDAGVYAGLGLVASLTYALTAHRLGLYRLDELLDRERDHVRVWASWGLAVLVLAVILFLFKSGGAVSRGSVVCFSVLGGLGLVLWRRAAKRRLRAALLGGAIRGRRVILIGTHHELAQFSRRDLLIRFGLEEVERVVLPYTTNGLGGFADASIGTVLQRTRVVSAEEIILALSWSDPAEVERLVDRFRAVPLPVRLLPDRAVSAIVGRRGRSRRRSYMVEIQRAPLTPLERAAKRLMDVTVATISLLILAPVMLLAAIAIRLESPGPVIFRQRRHGFNGQPFVIYKFRTMRVLEDGAAVVQAARKDPRVTRVGRILRQTSIDELPQLVNVLRGDMSIVGPRPHALVHDHEYGKIIANYAFRHHVKPGITGWAQVQGCRGATPRLELMEQRIAFDLWYINNWSLGLDIGIVMRTFFELIRRRNAY